MRSKIYLLTLMFYLFVNDSIAQQGKTLDVSNKTELIQGLPNLTVNDSLPNFLIPVVINPISSKMSTSDFKEKLLIIDFWSIYCKGCIEALPKLDSLQNKFKDKLQILPVTYEPEALVRGFWTKNKNTKHLSLPSVVEDKLFASYFRHQTIPHEVWVYRGKVIAITTGEYVDESNIRKILSGESINWPIKNDFLSFDGTKKSIFKFNGDHLPKEIRSIQYAAISDYKEGVNAEGLSGGAGIVRDTINKSIRVFFLNQSIYTAYLLNFAKAVSASELIKPSPIVTPNQVIWEVKNKSKYSYDSRSSYLAEWIRANGICFESLSPDTGQQERQIAAGTIADLNRLLGLKVRWERRKEKVLILRADQESKLDAKPKNQFVKEKHQTPLISLSTLTYQLNQQAENPYVFNETGNPANLLLDINVPSWRDISSIRKALLLQGLNLREEERMVDKLIFTEIDDQFRTDKN